MRDETVPFTLINRIFLLRIQCLAKYATSLSFGVYHLDVARAFAFFTCIVNVRSLSCQRHCDAVCVRCERGSERICVYALLIYAHTLLLLVLVVFLFLIVSAQCNRNQLCCECRFPFFFLLSHVAKLPL